MKEIYGSSRIIFFQNELFFDKHVSKLQKYYNIKLKALFESIKSLCLTT